MDKLKLEIVVSRFNEDISWTTPYKSIVTIYNKGNDYIENAINLPNVGRESHTYLSHIIQNYDKLAEKTVFFQGAGPSFGYRNNSDGGHMISNLRFEDYLSRTEDLFYVLTSRIKSDLSQISVRNGYNKYLNLPRPISCFPTNRNFDYWLKWTCFLHFKDYIKNLKDSQSGNLSLQDFWDKYISSNHKIPAELVYAQGAQFAISKRMILQHSKEYYQQLLNELANDINPYQGYYMEWLWLYIFSKNKLR